MKIKNTIIILSIIFFGNTASSQSYKLAFRADMCDCLTLESQKRNLTENAYKACFREILPKYATQIDAEIEEEDVNKKYLLGQLARRDLIVVMQSELVYTCTAYFDHLESEKLSKKLIAREQAKESDLEAQDQLVAMAPNTYSYFSRAQLHYNLGNFKEAEADLKKCAEVNPNKDNIKSRRHELLLMALIHEENKDYAQAISLYDLAYFGVFDSTVAILRAIADKNNGGTIANIPKFEDENLKPKDLNNKSRRRLTTRSKTTTKTAKKKTNNQKKQSIKKSDTSSLKKLFKIDN
ncbi:tetratricopeptide repeat protein [Ichthyenterobacterium magnum]|uniref:Tetratricopeptide repeat protein n=1 Tax=Ichthyenterobacterium magnum TaxID=1230530 RepID=A0A420DL53_9FLAO|nr:tetratricopeptide repeat protein [Ichthyenterobacterium magnum]RKE94949.1 tetratricopeptide repeat protein [Ichthyenterobacterium magnum]